VVSGGAAGTDGGTGSTNFGFAGGACGGNGGDGKNNSFGTVTQPGSAGRYLISVVPDLTVLF
jgi:hypothetical protein